MLEPIKDINIEITGYGKDADLRVLDYVVRGVNWIRDFKKNPALLERENNNPKISVYPPLYDENDDMKEMRKFLGCKPSVSGAMFELAIKMILWTIEYGEGTLLGKLNGDKYDD